MGLTAERVARHYNVSREDQDAFALESHRKAVAAQAAGRFNSELVPVPVTTAVPGAKAGKPTTTETLFSVDEGRGRIRQRRRLQAEAGLPCARDGDSRKRIADSDGAAAVVLMDEERANELSLKPLARLVAYAVTGCLPEEMGIGPITAIPKALRRAGLTLNEIDLIELNEAFASQALAVMRESASIRRA